jgi:hypothetical protein
MHEQDWTWMWSYCLFGWAAFGIIKHRMGRCSVLLPWCDIGHTSYTTVCIVSFIWAWHKPIRTLCWSERIILSYIRTSIQNDSWVPDKLICIFTFHSVSEIFSWIIISPAWWTPDVFSLKHYRDHFLPYVYRRCLGNVEYFLTTSPPIPRYFGPSAHRQLYFCSRFCHCAVWCTDSAVCSCSFRSTLYTGNYEFKQISSPRISMLKFYEYVMQSLLFKYMDHRLEYLSLSLEKF